MVDTTYTILRADGSQEVRTIDLPAQPSLDQLEAIVIPVIGPRGDMERVRVLHGENYTDMFVDELGQLKRLPRNEKATAIYRNKAMTHQPETDPEDLPSIVGAAVLFHRRVWF